MKIELRNIKKQYSQIKIFNSLDLTIQDNEIISILGPNGCGKSTLLNIIAQIDKNFNGELNTKNTYKISYMFQKPLLIPWRDSLKNAFIGIEIINKPSIDNFNEAIELFNKFNIIDKLHTFPSLLSGGEQQKVSLIRTLLPKSDLILLDEPFSAIDFQSKIKIYEWIFDYFKKNNKTVIMVTHDIEEAITLSDKIIILNNKPKDIYKIIDIDIPKEKRNPIKLRKNIMFTTYFTEIWNNLEEIGKNEI